MLADNSTTPTDSTNPTNSTKLTNSAYPTNPTTSTNANNLTNSTDPINSTNSTDPINSTNSNHSINSFNTTNANNLTNSTDPINSTNSKNKTTPTNLANSTKNNSYLNLKQEHIVLPQWYPYKNNKNIPVKESLNNILSYLDETKQDHLEAFTELIIVPGYKMKILDALVTNFHQPNSTLLLLIASILNDEWKNIYNHALNNDYRFLSYGDSCLFFK